MEQPTKRQRLNEFDDDDENETGVNVSEIAEYQTMQMSSCGDVLQWWKTHLSVFPGLSLVAKRYLCTMATSAASERIFSLAGFVVNERRSCLKPDNVNDILLVNSALK